MSGSQGVAVVGVFDDRQTAIRVLHALKRAGFSEDEIGVAGGGDHSDEFETDDRSSDDSYAGEAAFTGAVAGAGAGALWGLGILAGMLPAVGPAIAGGTLAALLSSAAAGAAAAGLTGALIGMGLSKDEAEFYESEIQAGRTIVTIQARGRRQEALNLVREHGGYDMYSRNSFDRSTDTTYGSLSDLTTVRNEDQDSCCSTGDVSESGHMVDSTTVQDREEKINMRTPPVDTGDVTGRKEFPAERQTIDVPVTREEIVIQRRPGTGAEITEEDLNDNEKIRVPERSGRVDVQKVTVVADGVSVGVRSVQSTQRVDQDLRK